MDRYTSGASASERSDSPITGRTGVALRIAAKGLSEYSLRVLRERARLAIEDPVGELEAVAPLSHEQAWYNLTLADGELAERARPLPEANGDLAAALGITRHSGRRLCPAHADRHPSLTYWHKPDGFLMVKCQAGCTYGEIRRAALG